MEKRDVIPIASPRRRLPKGALPLLLLSAGIFTSLLHAHHSTPAQLRLDAQTARRAAELRRALLHPIAGVRASRRALKELARIPDPHSLDTWRALLLQPQSYPSSVRKAAAQTLADFRGASDDEVAELLCEALAEEPVREVMREIARSLEKRAQRIPPGLRAIATSDRRDEWRSYAERVLLILQSRQPADHAGLPLPRHAQSRAGNTPPVIESGT